MTNHELDQSLCRTPLPDALEKNELMREGMRPIVLGDKDGGNFICFFPDNSGGKVVNIHVNV